MLAGRHWLMPAEQSITLPLRNASLSLVLLMNEYKDAPPTETILLQCSYLFILEGGIPRMAA